MPTLQTYSFKVNLIQILSSYQATLYAIKNANADEKTTNQIPIQTITQQELGRPKMSKDKQEICVKTGKSKTYNLVHPKRLAANIYF